MKSIKMLLASIVALTLVVGCSEDVKEEYTPIKQVKLKLVLMDGTEEMALGDHANLTTGFDFEISLFKLYVSNISLTTTQGNKVLVKDVDIISLPEENENIVTLSVPHGEYNNVSIGYGLNPKQNNADPTSYEESHPLSNFQSMYWPMIKYRFAKVEGYAVSNTDSSDYLVSMHPGTDALYQMRDYKLFQNLKVDDNTAETLLVTMDINDLFTGPGGVIDFSKEGANQVHSIETGPDKDIHIAQRFMENLSAATKLEVVPPAQ